MGPAFQTVAHMDVRAIAWMRICLERRPHQAIASPLRKTDDTSALTVIGSVVRLGLEVLCHIRIIKSGFALRNDLVLRMP
jgi:hypothetical protein